MARIQSEASANTNVSLSSDIQGRSRSQSTPSLLNADVFSQLLSSPDLHSAESGTEAPQVGFGASVREPSQESESRDESSPGEGYVLVEPEPSRPAEPRDVAEEEHELDDGRSSDVDAETSDEAHVVDVDEDVESVLNPQIDVSDVVVLPTETAKVVDANPDPVEENVASASDLETKSQVVKAVVGQLDEPVVTLAETTAAEISESKLESTEVAKAGSPVAVEEVVEEESVKPAEAPVIVVDGAEDSSDEDDRRSPRGDKTSDQQSAVGKNRSGTAEPRGTAASDEQQATPEPVATQDDATPKAKTNEVSNEGNAKRTTETGSKQPVPVAQKTATSTVPSSSDAVDTKGRAAPVVEVSAASNPPPNNQANQHVAPSRFQQNIVSKAHGRDAESSRVTLDSAKFLPRVSNAFAAAAKRGGEVRIRLNPPELGSLRLEVKMQGGSMTARIDAETPAARQAILESLPILKDRLAEQGMRIEQFEVGLMDQQDRDAFEQQQQNDRRGSSHSGRDEERQVEDDGVVANSSVLSETGSLDVVA